VKFFSENTEHINGECECGRVLKVKRSGAIKTSDGYNLTPNIRCFCGSIHNKIYGSSQSKTVTKQDDEVYCPKCYSKSLSANKQGFSVGKSITGGVLAGPVGLLGGFWNSGDIKITCLKCGHTFKPGVKLVNCTFHRTNEEQKDDDHNAIIIVAIIIIGVIVTKMMG